MHVTDLIRTYGNRIIYSCLDKNDKRPIAERIREAAKSIKDGETTTPKLGTLRNLVPEIEASFAPDTASAIKALITASEKAVKNDITTDCLVLKQTLNKSSATDRQIIAAIDNVLLYTIDCGDSSTVLATHEDLHNATKDLYKIVTQYRGGEDPINMLWSRVKFMKDAAETLVL